MKTNFLIVIAIMMMLSNSNAQEVIIKDTINIKKSNPLNGLVKAHFQDIDQSQPLMLDGISIPVYSDKSILIQGEEFNKTMMSGDYIPEPYIDSNKVVQAFVLRKATNEEKKQMMQFEDSQQNSSDLIGKEAFPFSATDISGNNYSLDELKGKVIVINFWFVECKPCVMEMPELNKLVEKYKNKEVIFLGFANNDQPKIEKFLKTKSFNYNIIANNSELVKLYNVVSFPTHIIIDKNSKVAFRVSGLGPTTIDDIDKLIEELTIK